MNYDIRKISDYMNEIHSRYYIDTNGIIYTSLTSSTHSIMKDGTKKPINALRNKLIKNLNKTNNMIIELPNFKDYYLLYNGEILQRLKTSIKNNKTVFIRLVTLIYDERKYFSVSRLVAQCFIGETLDKEVHHIDRNRMNNKVNNLLILTKEEHRGKNNYNKYHN